MLKNVTYHAVESISHFSMLIQNRLSQILLHLLLGKVEGDFVGLLLA